jgi:hypothetical protein
MMAALIASAVLQAASVSAQIMAAPAEVSPQTRALIAPVAASIAKVRAEQSVLPPPATDREKLLRMMALEQAPRRALEEIDFSKIPEAERKYAYGAVWKQIAPIDDANQKALLAMLPPEGWFTISRYGHDGATAAFLIVQHADLDLQKRFLPTLEKLASQGEVDGGDYALMFDRVAIGEGRPQRYGSQYECKGGKWTPYPLEDPARVEERRAAMKLDTFKDNQARFAAMPPC